MSDTFHEGELAVQEKAGVRAMAGRVGRIIETDLAPAARDFLSRQEMLLLSTVDSLGRPWVSIATGSHGFAASPDPRTVLLRPEAVTDRRVVENLRADSRVGLLAIELVSRKRLRVNGEGSIGDGGAIRVATREVFGNCPKYIQSRNIEPAGAGPSGAAPETRSRLDGELRELIAGADTFYIGSLHRERGADVSHRGGNPGFVRVLDDSRLAWGDYAGNNMFQTLGNIEEDAHTGLLFVDHDTGSTLQLVGRARVDWDPSRAAGFPGAQRVVDFEIDEAVFTRGALPVRFRFGDHSPFNPS